MYLREDDEFWEEVIDNHVLSFNIKKIVEVMLNMEINIKEYIDNISSAKFEELCVSYLRYLKGSNFIIKGTRYCKDGGKDIVGIPQNGIPYEIWAECKKHERSIGLDDISKNVVLVLSENINELFFFSTSNITVSAQKHISNLAAKHGFNVAFHYGDKLVNELSELPIFRNTVKLSSQDLEDKKELIARLYLSKYENSDYYESDSTIVLQRDTVFYIDIFLKNNTPKTIKNIDLEIPKSTYMLFNIQPYNKNFTLQPYCDRIVTIKINVINCIKKYNIPKIRIQYEYEEKKHRICLDAGIVDPTRLMYFPLIGEKLNNFLKLVAEPILKKPTSNTYIIDIRGGSGVGKSRLIKELLLLGETYNWHVKHYDGINNKDLNIIKDLLCSFIGLPFYSGNINFTSNEIKKILKSQGDNEEFADILYDFLYKNKIDNEILYYIEDAIIYFLKHPYLDYPYILAIDNIQEVDISVLDIIEHLINILENVPAKFIIILGTNTERIPNKNCEKVAELLNVLDSCNDNYRLLQELYPMDAQEAKTFYIGLLKNVEKHKALLKFLIDKAGTRPFDMIMQLKYMQDKNILFWQEGNSWYIQDFQKFDTFVNKVPFKSNELIQQRVQTQLSISNSNIASSYQYFFKMLVKVLLIFKNNLPINFLYYINLDENIVTELMSSLFFKYDDKEPEIHFYHNNLYLYFQDQKIYSYDIEVTNKTVLWLESSQECQIKNKDTILLDCYIKLGKYKLAKEKGIECMKKCFYICDYADAVSIAELLLTSVKFELEDNEIFKIKYLLADAYRERIDHEKGAQIYSELYIKLKEEDITLSEKERNIFYHKAVNANLNSNHPDLALEMLRDFEKTNIAMPFYQFILYDRYAVVYLALGDIDNSYINIKKAIDMAEKVKNDEWKGIAYSDYAYLQYRGYQDSEQACKYFLSAYNIQFSDFISKNRQSELLQQKAFAELLQGNLKNALLEVNMSIETSQKIHSTYLEAKAINLKGIIQILSGNQQEGLSTWYMGIDLCQKIKNLSSKIRLYCNIGAYYLAENNILFAKDNLLIAYNLFLDNHFSDVHYKELFYNLIRMYNFFGENLEIKKIIKKSSDIHIEEFYNYIIEQDLDANSKYGVLFYKNCNFIF